MNTLRHFINPDTGRNWDGTYNCPKCGKTIHVNDGDYCRHCKKRVGVSINIDPGKNYYYHPEMNSQYEFRQESDIDKRDQLPAVPPPSKIIPRIIPKITPGPPIPTGKGYISLSKKPR